MAPGSRRAGTARCVPMTSPSYTSAVYVLCKATPIDPHQTSNCAACDAAGGMLQFRVHSRPTPYCAHRLHPKRCYLASGCSSAVGSATGPSGDAGGGSVRGSGEGNGKRRRTPEEKGEPWKGARWSEQSAAWPLGPRMVRRGSWRRAAGGISRRGEVRGVRPGLRRAGTCAHGENPFRRPHPATPLNHGRRRSGSPPRASARLDCPGPAARRRRGRRGSRGRGGGRPAGPWAGRDAELPVRGLEDLSAGERAQVRAGVMESGPGKGTGWRARVPQPPAAPGNGRSAQCAQPPPSQ
jgi:hypothetical protein